MDWTSAVLPNDGTLEHLTLKKGDHKSRQEGVCVMEAVAWLAGEPHSDRPTCASPTVAALMLRLNDSMPDDQRQRLREFIPALVTSRETTVAQRKRRALCAADHAVRRILPIALRARGLEAHARTLEGLAPIASEDAARSAATLCRSAAAAAADAARRAAPASGKVWDAAIEMVRDVISIQ